MFIILHNEPTNAQLFEYIIMLLLYISTQLCLPCVARSQYLAKLQKYAKAIVGNTI